MKTTIRSLQGSEMLDALYTLASYSLHSSPPLEDRQEFDTDVGGRAGINCQATFEDDQAVSIAISTPMTQNMRGQLFAAGGVWGVATFPSARRKGYCRQTVTRVLALDREAGMVFSNLYPFRESFYQRLGYVAFPLSKTVRFATRFLEPALKIETGGEITLHLIGEAFDNYREYLAEMRTHQHGMALFDQGNRAWANKNLMWAAMAKFDGKIEGFMMYQLQGDESTKYNLSALRFFYKTSRARYLLLNWIARHIDQAEQVELRLPAGEYPETWLEDLRLKTEPAFGPAMSRILDVAKIGGMQVGEGIFSARIIDPICPWNEGGWRFESIDGRLQVSKVAHVECELSIQGLSALIAGVYEPQDFIYRGWGNPDPALQATMRVMFPQACPYMHEMF